MVRTSRDPRVAPGGGGSRAPDGPGTPRKGMGREGHAPKRDAKEAGLKGIGRHTTRFLRLSCRSVQPRGI
ncbi:hypothetical protein IBTHAUMO2_150016 [Nitrosopumilaceae archaeon]|nr:hypothetical protein IBTHAUMO2_150016 [Nitrosopumilaceae archaeon]